MRWPATHAASPRAQPAAAKMSAMKLRSVSTATTVPTGWSIAFLPVVPLRRSGDPARGRKHPVDKRIRAAEIVGGIGQPRNFRAIEFLRYRRLARQGVGKADALLERGVGGVLDDVMGLLSPDMRG